MSSREFIFFLFVAAALASGRMVEIEQRRGAGQGSSLLTDVIILSGQSNMAGRGGVHTSRVLANGSEVKIWDGIVPPESAAPPGSILRFNAALEWEEAREPLHVDIDLGKVCGIGPGLTLAATLVNHSSVNHPAKIFGVVPCARGATSIREWTKGTDLYTKMVERTKAAMVAADGAALRALVWYQGESDTLSEELANEYGQQLERFIRDVRLDLDSHSLPFIQVGITARNHPHPRLLERVRQAQRGIKLPGVFYVDAQGLGLQGDGVHLTTHSQALLGEMLAASYIDNVVLINDN